MVLAGVVRRSLFDVIVEYLGEILFEGDDEGEDAIIFKGGLEVPCFMDEDLVEVGIIVLGFVLEVPGVDMGQGLTRVLVEILELLLQRLVAFYHYYVKLI